MNLDALWIEVEAEQEWREAELRSLQNVMAALVSDDERNRFRRALVVMLYAHFEGFCKFVLSLYVREVNRASITCQEATYAIAAAALSDLFEALRDPARKCAEFRNDLPNDEKLHRFARDREFIERTSDFGRRVVAIPDKVVDAEDNLKPIVLRKILYRLGLPHEQFDGIDDQIHRLLGFRNAIAHGSFREGISEEKFRPLYEAVFEIMNTVKHGIFSALSGRLFLRAS